jgi:oxygen-independent coproporphyrinogen-3 oxidase
MYLRALRLEARREARLWPRAFDSLYLGGGSPSLLIDKDLAYLKESLKVFQFAEDCEITLEANPEDVTEEKTALWSEFGATRISLGAQSFSPKALSGTLGRTHGPKEIEKASLLILDEGLSLSLDLIFGWSGQTPEDWTVDLNAAVSSGADHISAYSLTAPPGTSLMERLLAGSAAPLPEEDYVSELFLGAGELLKKEGFRRYEVSNFARPGFERRHNLKYWKRVPYLGLGPSAHSFDGARRSGNFPNLFAWAEALRNNGSQKDFEEDIGPVEARLESFLLGLRLSEGLPLSEIRDRKKLSSLLRDGFLFIEKDRVRPTEKGFLTADYLARELS